MTSLWIDTDMGFDDMLAILMISQSTRQVAGCSLVFGCAVLEQVIQNAAGFQHTFNWPVVVHVGAARPLARDLITAEHVLGKTGVSTIGATLPDNNTLTAQVPALQALINWLEGESRGGEVLALGPLTNIAKLVQTRPDLLTRITQVTWMGGAATRGNQTEYAEFNAFADPEAVAIVCASELPLRMVDLDTCRQVSVTERDLLELQEMKSANARLLHDLFAGYINIALTRGRESMALYDPVAAASVLDKSAVQYDNVKITVDLKHGQQYGRTLIESQQTTRPKHQIGSVASAEKIRSMALRALSNAAR